MKLKTILLIPGLAATSLCFPNFLLAQTEPPVATASPAAPEASGAPKFGPEDGGAGHSEKKGRSPEQRIARLKDALGLTADQETKLREIFRAEGEKIRAEHKAEKEAPLTPEEQKTKMEAVRDRVNGLISAMLTTEQQTKFEALKARNQGKGKAGKDQSAAPKP